MTALQLFVLAFAVILGIGIPVVVLEWLADRLGVGQSTRAILIVVGLLVLAVWGRSMGVGGEPTCGFLPDPRADCY